MSTAVNVLLPSNSVVAPRFDVDAFDRDRARSVAAQAAIAEARERVEQFEAERPDILADMQRRAQLALDEPLAPATAPKEQEATEPGAHERALEEIIQRRLDAAGVQAEATRQAEHEFMIAVMGEALGEATDVLHKRIDQLEHDLLSARGLLHENNLAVRAMVPPADDDYAPRLPRVRIKCGSRKVVDRMPNRVPLTHEASTPWFNDGP
jgi:hypothetical protein